jgi:hypothetical protein
MKGLDLFFIPKPFGNSTSWQDIRTLKFKGFHRHLICFFLREWFLDFTGVAAPNYKHLKLGI